MERAKLVHIIDNLALGGAEVLLLSTIKRLPQFEHHVILLTSQVHLPEVTSYATLHIIDHRGWHHIFRSHSRLRKLIRQLNPAVIHAHLFLASVLSRLAIGKQANFVYTIHSLYSASIFKSPVFRLIEKSLFRKRHKLVAVSQTVLDDYKKVVTKCSGGYVLYNFIEDSFLSAVPEKTLEPLPVKWVAVGSFRPEKDYAAGFASLSALQAAYPANDILLDIYGDGPLRTEIEAQVRELSFISLKGRMTNLSPILDEYDAYISTSASEGYGIAPMEALARGLPLFLNDIPVYREIYEKHAHYFRAARENGNDFLRAYEAYVQLSPSTKQAKTLEGRKYAERVANSSSYLDSLLKIYASAPSLTLES